MTSLPIVRRELTVAGRQPWTDLNLHLAARSANAPNRVGRFAAFAALGLSLTALVRFTRPTAKV
jgi:hypothetical protein